MYKRILSLFPEKYFRYCFAYGSGVFHQKGMTVSKPMIDLIFVVDDVEGFHGQNVLMNPRHYSGLRHFGHHLITGIQKFPSKVYFNTLIPIKEEGVVLKYGIISRKDLINDLLDWNYLYIAGRLHKPVEDILPSKNADILSALKNNLYSVIHTSLLLLPEFFTERQLYRTIASVSYYGDFRMLFGEDKNKVNNIVDAQIPKFRKLYRPLLQNLTDYVEIPDFDENEASVDQLCMQDMGAITRQFHLYQLPRTPQQVLVTQYHKIVRTRRHDTEDALNAISQYPYLSDMLSSSLRSIVFKSSIEQSLKGILTAGITKSIRYSSKKILKMFYSLKKPYTNHVN